MPRIRRTFPMLQRWLVGLAVALTLGGGLAQAQEEIFVRGKEKPIKGAITKESPKEIVVGVKDVVPAEDIIDIVYDLRPISANLNYRKGVQSEKESFDPAKEKDRKTLLADALKKYEESHAA